MNTNVEYQSHLWTIIEKGEEVSPRGIACKEILNLCYIVSMRNPLITLPEREMGYKFAAREAWWIITGSNRLDDIKDYGKMAPFSDDGFMLRGAYGPKVVDQIPYICRSLSADKETRQAVLSTWRERPESSKDIPCSLTMQFITRNNQLHCIVNMRSSDAILGLPYDSITFSCIATYVLSILKHYYDDFKDTSLGLLYVNAGSSHIYLRDLGLAQKIINSTERDTGNMNLDLYTESSPNIFVNDLKLASDHDDGILFISMVY